MKYSFTNQNFHKSTLPLFREFNFLKKDIYVNKGAFRLGKDAEILDEAFGFLNGKHPFIASLLALN